MKKIIYLFVLTIFLAGCSSKPHFLLKADIKGSDSVTFMLYNRVAGSFVTIDSAISKNGHFVMKGVVKNPETVILIASGKNQRKQFFLENAKMTITGNLDSLNQAKVTGSKTQDEYESLIKAEKPLSQKDNEKYQQYQVAVQSQDTATAHKLEKELNSIEGEMSQMKKDFIKNHPSSYLSPLLITDLSIEMKADEIEAAINSLDSNVAKIDYLNGLKARVRVMKTVDIGQKAPDFTLNDVNDNPVSLSSKIGSKLLLIDFWASWCNPCRQENPNVVKVYNEFHKKGFDAFGVSLDKNKEDWTKAIADDKLVWTHVSDLQYWNSAAAALYAVNSIPANFLLDEKGIIIARNLRGEDLYNKVKEVLGK